jgi:hypothetical protein
MTSQDYLRQYTEPSRKVHGQVTNLPQADEEEDFEKIKMGRGGQTVFTLDSRCWIGIQELDPAEAGSSHRAITDYRSSSGFAPCKLKFP